MHIVTFVAWNHITDFINVLWIQQAIPGNNHLTFLFQETLLDCPEGRGLVPASGLDA